MLRFSKVQKKSKSDVALCCSSVKNFLKANKSHEKPSHSSKINTALLWCRSAHKLFDMDSTKLSSIALLQEKLESLAASGTLVEANALAPVLAELETFGFEIDTFTQEASDTDEKESNKEYEQEACKEIRRALRICYEERELKI